MGAHISDKHRPAGGNLKSAFHVSNGAAVVGSVCRKLALYRKHSHYMHIDGWLLDMWFFNQFLEILREGKTSAQLLRHMQIPEGRNYFFHNQ